MTLNITVLNTAKHAEYCKQAHYAECNYAEFHGAEWHHAKCHSSSHTDPCLMFPSINLFQNYKFIKSK